MNNDVERSCEASIDLKSLNWVCATFALLHHLKFRFAHLASF